jgi:hypothetical protein
MDLITAVKATYEVIGQEISDLAMQAIVAELSEYPPQSVLLALTRCRKELRRVSLAEILDRLPGGHPGAEEAWAIVAPVLNDENASVVWTREMAEAYGATRSLADDPIAARMAFREVYTSAVQRSRATNHKPSWLVSLGHDPKNRERVVQEAVMNGRLTAAQAVAVLPDLRDPATLVSLPAVKGF